MLKRLICVTALLAVAGCGRPRPKAIVLGFDGCDPRLLRQFMADGSLPSFLRLAETGSFQELGTTLPPQSPVAWATFITGLGPGGHGIFDFIERDPETMKAIPSMSRVEKNGTVSLLRDGKPFWTYLTDHGIPATLLKVPVDFPPRSDGSRQLTGMGTPDLLGTYGTFTYYSEEPLTTSPGSIVQGALCSVRAVNDVIRASLIGPSRGSDQARLDFTVWRDPTARAVVIELAGERFLLKEREWSSWRRVRFSLPWGGTASGMLRFFVSSVRPFALYVSPINLDPRSPDQAISSPSDFGEHLDFCTGSFYTQGMAEDTKALSAGALDDVSYLQQSDLVYHDTERLLDQGLRELKEGLLFGYLSSTDLQCHMYWRDFEAKGPHAGVVEDTYRKADALLGRALRELHEGDVLFVVSDHGFAPFKRAFDLNAWLRENGYLQIQNYAPLETANWHTTRAYAVGFNGLYLNLIGREAHGSVAPAQKEAMLAELSGRLKNVRDPKTGERVILNIYRGADVNGGRHQNESPDLIIGYARGYRASWRTALGQTDGRLLADNDDHWSGDHLMDPSVVPGVLLCSRKLIPGDASLRDLAPTIVRFFGIAPGADIKGRDLLKGTIP